MKYAQIDSCECNNGLNVGITLFTQGCHYHCPQCHNSSIWSFDEGYDFIQEEKDNFLSLLEKPYVHRVSIQGGEPLLPQNTADLALLIHNIKVKREDVKIWLWTGTTFEDLYKLVFLRQESNDTILNKLGWDNRNLADLTYILNQLDYMIDGRFIQEQKDLTLKFRGSKNQRWLDMKKSIAAGKAISAE